jgi:hypothetical protein
MSKSEFDKFDLLERKLSDILVSIMAAQREYALYEDAYFENELKCILGKLSDCQIHLDSFISSVVRGLIEYGKEGRQNATK